MEDEQGVGIAERDIEMGVEFLGLALELALPFGAGAAGLATSELPQDLRPPSPSGSCQTRGSTLWRA